MIRCILFLVVFSTTVFGQVLPTRIGQHMIGETLDEWHRLEPDAIRQSGTSTSQPSAIAPHRVGETFSQWLNLNQMNMSEICGNHKRNDRSADYKAICKKLSEIQETGQGEFHTTNQLGHTFGWRFVDGKVMEYSNDGKWQNSADALADAQNVNPNELVTKHDNRSYTWKFTNGKLSEVAVTPDWAVIYRQYNEEGIARHPEIVPAFREEMDFLTQTYGKPSKVEAVPYQNAYGAHWERARVIWNAPDGSQIVAFERKGFNQRGQLELVSFISKEALTEAQQTKPNPYK